MMKRIIDIYKIPATILAGIGFLFTLYIHVNAFNFVRLSNENEIPDLLEYGIFLIWLSAILVLVQRQKEVFNENKDLKARLKLFVSVFLGDLPRIFLIIPLSGYLYSNYYGWTSSLNFEGFPEVVEGKYHLKNHGSTIKELTKEEFIKLKSIDIKSTTSTLMLFYNVATCILVSTLFKKK